MPLLTPHASTGVRTSSIWITGTNINAVEKYKCSESRKTLI